MIERLFAPLRRRRVYYALLVLLALTGIGSWAISRATPARGQVDIIVEPAMVKGAANAAVTIVEFSDYQ